MCLLASSTTSLNTSTLDKLSTTRALDVLSWILASSSHRYVGYVSHFLDSFDSSTLLILAYLQDMFLYQAEVVLWAVTGAGRLGKA